VNNRLVRLTPVPTTRAESTTGRRGPERSGGVGSANVKRGVSFQAVITMAGRET